MILGNVRRGSDGHQHGTHPLADVEIELLKQGTILKGRYEIVRRIKTGGMGAVYEVEDRTVGRKRRALKVMLPGIVTESMRERFRQEAVAPAKIDSENVVDVLDQGVDEATGLPFLVMELLKGEDLDTRLERGPLLPEEALLHLHRASLALDCAHAADIVHRDIKPENLFVTAHDDGTENLKVLDFGIAKIVAESSRAKTTLSLGTPLYMSPEQILGDGEIGPSADIYSLAHVAFTLLAGRGYWKPEFESMAPVPFLALVARGTSERASVRAARMGTALSSKFDVWFAQATAVNAGDRFDSTSELVTELAQALGVALPRPSRHSFSGRPGGAVANVARTLPSSSLPGDIAEVARDRPRAPFTGTDSTSALSSSARRRRERGGLLIAIVVVALAALGYRFSGISKRDAIDQRPSQSPPAQARAEASTGTATLTNTSPSPSRSAAAVASLAPVLSQSPPQSPPSSFHAQRASGTALPRRAAPMYDPMDHL